VEIDKCKCNISEKIRALGEAGIRPVKLTPRHVTATDKKQTTPLFNEFCRNQLVIDHHARMSGDSAQQ
jgi:hypothetical protein